MVNAVSLIKGDIVKIINKDSPYFGDNSEVVCCDGIWFHVRVIGHNGDGDIVFRRSDLRYMRRN